MTEQSIFVQPQSQLSEEVWDYILQNRKTKKVKMGYWKAETVEDLIKAGILK